MNSKYIILISVLYVLFIHWLILVISPMQSIPMSSGAPYTIGSSEANTPKNRFLNIFPCKKSFKCHLTFTLYIQ